MVNTSQIAGDQLRSFFERIEQLTEDKSAISEDIKEVFAQAKSLGFDVAVMRKVLALRKMDQADRQELEALTDLYLHVVEGNHNATGRE